MSIQSVQSLLGGITPDIARSRDGAHAPVREPREQLAVPSTPPVVASGRDVVPAEAPHGTDPALWQVLTPEERSFFAKARTMGPLTYGRGSSSDSRMAGVAQGGRIDVRV